MLALFNQKLLATRNLDDRIFLTVITDDDDATYRGIFIVNVNAASGLVHLGFDLRATCFEEFLNTRQTLGNIGCRGRTTGVEGTHRQLGTGLTNRLGSDNTDGLADIHLLAGGQ